MIRTEALATARYREDDIQAFESLVRRYDKQLYNIALRMTGNSEEAKDLVQEALVRAYRSFGAFKLGTSFERWLYRIATNLFLDRLRKAGRFQVESIDDPITTPNGEIERELPDWSTNPEAVAMNNELHNKIQEALMALPPEYRMAVILADVHGFSYEEISGILKCSIGTVRSRIHRGRRILRDKLRPYLASA
ncbi:MAG: sigma-70 family RNA polymerase sigma factor [Firmicutes bacterium]|nr:sigma-70 family RNA polymerase sigma factor [Bacillota bacterium]